MIYFGLIIFAIYLVFKFLYIYLPLRYEHHKETKAAHSYKGFAILIPAYNEESVIVNCVNSLCDIVYPSYRVYIIDDGSTDSTFDVLHRHLCLRQVRIQEDVRLEYAAITSKWQSRKYPYIFVICKQNGGKADALNAGISCCCEEVVVTLDADCMLKDDAIEVMNGVFQDNRIIAAGGTVQIIQSVDLSSGKARLKCRLKNIIKYQMLQYLMAFYLHKFTQSRLNALIVISGAYGAFRRSALIDIRGYRRSVGEDMDITLKLHRYIKTKAAHCAMAYVPQSICYTECPESLKNLTRQRLRWQKAFVDCAIKYGRFLFRRFKAGISLFFLLDALLLGTLTTLMFLLIPLLIILSGKVTIVFIVLFLIDFFIGIAECSVAFIIAQRFGLTKAEKNSFRLGFFIPFQLLTFRFLNITYIVSGTVSYAINKNHWNKADRLGRSLSIPKSIKRRRHYRR